MKTKLSPQNIHRRLRDRLLRLKGPSLATLATRHRDRVASHRVHQEHLVVVRLIGSTRRNLLISICSDWTDRLNESNVDEVERILLDANERIRELLAPTPVVEWGRIKHGDEGGER